MFIIEGSFQLLNADGISVACHFNNTRLGRAEEKSFREFLIKFMQSNRKEK